MTGSPQDAVLRSWGGGNRARSLVYRPRDADEVGEAIRDARGRGLTVTARGAGLSYGDAALTEGGAVLDMRGLGAIHDLDAVGGTLRAGAGVTIADVWRAALPHGWWPTVVPGTMGVTLGGAVAMNIHGKNHGPAGALGRHVVSVALVDGSGTRRTVGPAPEVAPGVRDALTLVEVVGAQGLTGTLVEVTLRLKRVYSGYLRVHGWATRSLAETLEAVDRGGSEADYSVAWVDCGGRRPGRGVVHHAWHPGPDDALAGHGMEVERQTLPERVGGVVPAGQAWRFLRPFLSPGGIRVLNGAKFLSASAKGVHRYAATHAAFHFLLDYVPGWQRAYGESGLIQYQMFVPAAAAREAFTEALHEQASLGLPGFLGVLKRHREEPESAAPYSVEGFSLAMDFPVGRGERHTRLMRLVHRFDRILRAHGGRLYAAKDAVGLGTLPERRDRAFSSNLVRRWERGSR